MSNALTITTDVVSYRAQVEKLAKLTGRGLRDVMREMVSIMSGQLARRFPPKSKAQGTKAIKNDLNRIFITDDKVLAEWDVAVEQGTTGAVASTRIFRTQTGAVFGIEKELYRRNAGISEMNQHHLKYRSETTGRVSRAGSYTHDIGRWKFIDKMFVGKASYNAYVKFVAASVGSLKSGWAVATTRFKGAKKLPLWILAHGNDNGSVTDAMKENGDGHILFTNETPYASRWASINEFVLGSQKKMLQYKIRYELKKQAEAFNSKRAA
jgi:hypothetical protein